MCRVSYDDIRSLHRPMSCLYRTWPSARGSASCKADGQPHQIRDRACCSIATVLCCQNNYSAGRTSIIAFHSCSLSLSLNRLPVRSPIPRCSSICKFGSGAVAIGMIINTVVHAPLVATCGTQKSAQSRRRPCSVLPLLTAPADGAEP